MQIIDKYLFFSILKSSLITLMGIVLVFSFFKFLEEINDVGTANYRIETSLKYIALLIPSLLNSFLVLSLMIGAVFSLGQMNVNKELQIFQVATISTKELMIKSIKFPFYVSIILIIFFESFSPRIIRIAEELKANALEKTIVSENQSFWLLLNDVFYFINDAKENSSIEMFEIANNKDLKVYKKGDNLKFFPDFISFNEKKYLGLDSENNFLKISKGDLEKSQKISIDFNQIYNIDSNLNTFSIYELSKMVFSNKNLAANSEASIELVSRIVKPLTLIGMLLIAMPYVFSFQRTISIGRRIFLSISIGVITHLLTKIFSVIYLKFNILNALGLFIPSLMLILVGLILLKIKLKFG